MTRLRLPILLTPPTLWLLLFGLTPLLAMVLFSFRVDSFNAGEGYTLESYRTFFENGTYPRILWQTVQFSATVALVAVVLAYPVAYFLAFRAGQRKTTLLALMIAPAWTSYLLRILAWKLILGSQGVLSTLLKSLGIVAADASLPLLLYSPQAVMITLVYVWIPFAALPIFVSLERIDRKLFEAASDLGANDFKTFLRITLPLSLPGILASFIYVFIVTLGEWVTPQLVGGAQGGALYGNLIQNQFTRALNWPLGSVLSLALIVLMLVILLIYNRVTRVSLR